MAIAFNCYDFDKEQVLLEDDIRLLLKSIPNFQSRNQGISFDDDENLGNQALYSRNNLDKLDSLDQIEVNQLVENIFKIFDEEIYFEEFCFITEKVTSELYYSIF